MLERMVRNSDLRPFESKGGDPSSNISSMRHIVSSPDETTDKRVENTMDSTVFMMNFELFHLVMEQ